MMVFSRSSSHLQSMSNRASRWHSHFLLSCHDKKTLGAESWASSPPPNLCGFNITFKVTWRLQLLCTHQRIPECRTPWTWRHAPESWTDQSRSPWSWRSRPCWRTAGSQANGYEHEGIISLCSTPQKLWWIPPWFWFWIQTVCECHL